MKNFDQSQKLFVTPRKPIICKYSKLDGFQCSWLKDCLSIVCLDHTKMLASTLMRQHSRCLSGLSRQILSQKNVKLPKNSLVPTQCLTTSPALQHGSGDHTKMWSAERFVSLIQIPAVIVPFMWTTPATDALFCTLAVLHSHWGMYMHMC